MAPAVEVFDPQLCKSTIDALDTISRGGFGSVLACRFGVALKALSKTQRTHVGPHFTDVGEALLFRATLADLLPAERHFLGIRPDRVLLFVIQDHIEYRVLVVPDHLRLRIPAAKTGRIPC